jgi:formate/nitrite transporter
MLLSNIHVMKLPIRANTRSNPNRHQLRSRVKVRTGVNKKFTDAHVFEKYDTMETHIKNADHVYDTQGPPHKVNSKIIETLSDDAMKAHSNLGILFVKAILAGVFIGLGGVLCSSVGGDVPELNISNPGLQRAVFGAIGFPLSIFLVTTFGATAMTGTVVMVSCAYLMNKLSFHDLLSTLTISWLGNLIGLVAIAGLANLGNMDATIPCVAISVHKLSASWWNVFFKGIGGGILVCSAIVQAYAARNGVEKLLGIWFCISTYVICGWEHGLANAFFFPSAIFTNTDIVTWNIFIHKNLIPATIGNILGGFLLACAITIIHINNRIKIKIPSITIS